MNVKSIGNFETGYSTSSFNKTYTLEKNSTYIAMIASRCSSSTANGNGRMSVTTTNATKTNLIINKSKETMCLLSYIINTDDSGSSSAKFTVAPDGWTMQSSGGIIKIN